jgi:hypothetical protein
VGVDAKKWMRGFVDVTLWTITMDPIYTIDNKQTIKIVKTSKTTKFRTIGVEREKEC